MLPQESRVSYGICHQEGSILGGVGMAVAESVETSLAPSHRALGPVYQRQPRPRPNGLSSLSSLVTPGGWPRSTSSWRTQRRTDSAPTPTCLATASQAAVNEEYSEPCSFTSRTALAFSC